MTGTLIDCFELPLPAIERYRVVPMQSLDLEVEFDDSGEFATSGARGSSGVGERSDAHAPPSDRLLRARCWSSED